MKLAAKALASIFAIGTLTGCVVSLGPVKAATISETGFHSVEFGGAADINITIGDEESIDVRGAEKVIDSLTTEVVDGVLIIDHESTGFFGGNGDLKIDITMKELRALEISGAADVEVEGVDSEEFALVISGACDLDISGSVDHVDITASGASDIEASDLKSKTADVVLSGAGDIDLHASESVDLNVSGAGSVTYHGDPEKVTKSVSGVGDISKA